MKPEIHGITCACCKPASPEAKLLINEINKILNEFGTVNTDTPRKETIKKFREVATLFDKPIKKEDYSKFKAIKPENQITGKVGSIKPLLDLVEAVFSLPDGDVDYEILKLTDPEKKVQGIKISELSQNPNLDISKVIDFSKIKLNMLKNVKISLVPPTINATVTLGFGPVSLGLHFKIGIKSISWSPEFKFPNIKDAVKNLKGLTYKKMLTESGNEKLESLKQLAAAQFSDNKPALTALNAAKTSKDFFGMLSMLGLNIFKEIDVHKEVTEQQAELDLLKTLDTEQKLPLPGKTTAKDIGKIDLCPSKPAAPAPYRKDEIKDIVVCNAPADIKNDVKIVIPKFEIPDGNKELAKVNKFLDECKAFSDKMQECAKKKMEQENKWWALIEVDLLNDISILYFEAIRNHYETLNSTLSGIITKRNEIVDKYYNTTNYLSSNTVDVNQAAAIQASLTASEYKLTTVASNFASLKSTAVSQSSGTLITIREKLGSNKNLITNLVGYDYNFPLPTIDTLKWRMQVAPTVFAKAVELWARAKAAPAEPGTPGGVGSLLLDYIKPLALPVYGDNGVVDDRKGFLEDSVWKPFYSAKRIDNFYTYSEQGFNKQKPQYTDKGALIGQKKTKKIVNGQMQETIVDVPVNAEGLEVNMDIATAFLDTLETTIKDKVRAKANEIKNGSSYKSFLENTLLPAAKKEASKAFAGEFESSTYLDQNLSLKMASSSALNTFKRNSYVLKSFKEKIAEELLAITALINGYNDCVEKNKKGIEDAAKKLGDGGGGDSENLAKKCKKLLGSDPVGKKPPDGSCPSFLKNCYWTEFTKILQLVSLLPVPELDPQNLAMRLFRYYPVAIQIPVPAPIPVVLPTLAMGIPDIMISIPLPLLWKHIITVNTPLGTIVTWISMAGPIPSPFIMLVDEKGDCTFMLTSRGPCSIPHPTVGGINPLETVSLLDLLLPKTLFSVNMGGPLGKLLVGSTDNDSTDPDSGKNVIDKLKEKIKNSFDQLEIKDLPSIGGNSEEAKKRREKIKKALTYFPPDAKILEETIKEVFSSASKAIDELKISDIKIPKDEKGLMMSGLLGPLEVIDNLMKAADSAMSAPGAIGAQVLKDLGLGIKTINLTKKIKELVLKEVGKPSMKKFFKDLDVEIAELEAGMSFNVKLSSEEKIIKRVNKIKKIIKKPIEKAAESVSPDILGFIAAALDIPVLPFPCYTNIQLPPVPPYVYIIIAAIKAAPGIIDSLDAKTIAGLVSFELDLTKPLPKAETLFYNTINGVLKAIPNIEVPNGLGDDMFKQTISMIKQIPKKFKVRLPKPGLPIQIVIPGALIKTIIKQAAKIALDLIAALLITKVNQAIAEKKFEKIVAIALIIKALFGASLESIKGADIKAFIGGILESSAYPALDAVSSIITAANALKGDFLSIIELFQFPPKPSLLSDRGPYYEVSSELVKPIIDLAIQTVLPPLFNALPPIVTLLGASSTPARLVLTKLHPTKPIERLPVWEGLSSKNIPFLLWLDAIAATAQRKSGLGSTYLVGTGYQALP